MKSWNGAVTEEKGWTLVRGSHGWGRQNRQSNMQFAKAREIQATLPGAAARKDGPALQTTTSRNISKQTKQSSKQTSTKQKDNAHRCQQQATRHCNLHRCLSHHRPVWMPVLRQAKQKGWTQRHRRLQSLHLVPDYKRRSSPANLFLFSDVMEL